MTTSTPLPEQGGDTSMASYASWLLEDQCKKLLHMTSEEIAKVLDVSRPTVYVYLKNPSHMTVEKVDKLVHHLEAVRAMILTTEASDE